MKQTLFARPQALALDCAADRFLESYVAWREACADVRVAYESWQTCKPAQRILGFKSYGAALDREDAAARIHSRRVDQLHDAASPR